MRRLEARQERSQVSQKRFHEDPARLTQPHQSQSFIKECALFLDFELKKKSAARDPEVQLTIWVGAGLLKRWVVG